ncbi:TetR/AcrR family transcriptional repressor for divergent bdcA [Pseudoclavibacter sp. JAI123]|uniref:TetR/AcrR family transcriptional regulator n=1 Tax=Pseudoclavibacter sp. JAI123 TaxID=2723065 RepID=UPI0015C8C3AE|nr:TetR/AcrR family transcriptional regulator [Pseudoclavibacter sp. JAI123]NYF14872.1 TetR/AcrR family transcriptional repressor for divergent bdcA [Pseudoclavibacter sp. JAI123]
MAQQGRPRTFVEHEVLDAAMQVFWRHGYEASTVSQLREATGLSSASLYGAFGSKEGLFERAVERYIAGPGSVSEIVGDLTLNPLVALGQMLHGTIEMQSDSAHPGGCLVALSATVGAAGDDDAAARRVVSTRRAQDRAGIEACIRRGLNSGDLRADLDPAVSATLMHSFVLGISTQLLDGVPPTTLHAAVEALLEGLH